MASAHDPGQVPHLRRSIQGCTAVAQAVQSGLQEEEVRLDRSGPKGLRQLSVVEFEETRERAAAAAQVGLGTEPFE